MSDFSYSSSVFLSELMKLSTDIVWKNQKEAYANEDSVYAIDVEQYICAKRGQLTFDLIQSFDYNVLITAGLSAAQALAGVSDKSTIPSSYRSTCASLQVTKIIANYVEHNNYYRMLYGLPDNDDTTYFYNTKYPDISDSTTPIHLLTIQERYALENEGYFAELLAANPSKKYFKYLAEKNIDPYIARSASRFSILWMYTSTYSNLNTDFADTYNNCRYAIDKAYYSDAFKKNNDYYDNFMAMSILFMTIQVMHYKFLDADITRDFYDLESIKYVYESYGVPFYTSIPLEYHKQIVKNINILLSYKGSTRVFFELFDLFDFGMMEVHEYYLLKSHKFVDGKPVFIKNEDGTYNYREMYDIKFGKVKLYDDPPMELSDSGNHVAYEDLTANDIYWVSDEELMDTLYSEKFNYLETKYVGIQTVFNLTKIIYESTYYFKILLDNRTALAYTTIYYNGTSSNVNIFSLVIYLSALVCKKYGYEGNIETKLPTIAKVLGYNFKADLATLKANTLKNKYLKDDTTLINMLSSMNVNSLTSINTVFSKIASMKEYLSDKICGTHDRGEYFAYYELYNTLMYSKLIDTVFKKSDGTVAASFADLLSDIDSSLYLRYSNAELDLEDEISLALSVMKKSCSSLVYLDMLDDIDVGVIVEYLFKILDFFKSAKSELTGYNVVYMLTNRSANFMKFVDRINGYTDDVLVEDIIASLDDTFKLCTTMASEIDALEQLKDEMSVGTDLFHINSKISEMSDNLREIQATVLLIDDKENVVIRDYINRITDTRNLKSVSTFSDKLTLIHQNVVS